MLAEAWSTPRLPAADFGAVYTPRVLAGWVAAELDTSIGHPAVVWDIACGDGALLAALKALPRRHRVVGVDVDAEALGVACRRLPDGRFLRTDALAPVGNDADPVSALITALGGRPDAVILNPPWGGSLSRPREEYQRLGYSLAVGQFDTYDLFVELALSLLVDDGVAAFILPDSVLNSEHLGLRRLLLESTSVELVARLGEGFFPSVFRGVMVLLIRKRPPNATHRVRCFRLPGVQRKAVLAGREELASVAASHIHTVPQTWFTRSPQFRIDLDVRDVERKHLEKFEVQSRMIWRDWVVSGRGVELSKHGRILRCPDCSGALPLPRRPRRVTCRSCGIHFRSSDADVEQIVSEYKRTRSGSTWQPLIVGEDVRRYSVSASRLLQVGIPGIAYKPLSSYKSPKLLVRKTGVGLTTAVDRSDALTTQVVYHYKPLADRCEFVVDYLAAILNSRFMLAYHLRTRGDTEWRSHPYVTQRIIEELPVPCPAASPAAMQLAMKLARESRARADAPTFDIDAELRIEGLVARAYGFDSDDWRWALTVLEQTQALEGIKELRLDLRTPLVTEPISP